MAKRLRNIDRWKEQWFRELPFEAKGLLEYLEDNCDHAGIWPGDFGLMSFQTGITVTEESLMRMLGSLVIKLNSTTFFITTFFQDQYGESKDTFAAKVSAIKRLKKLGLMSEDGTLLRQSGDTPPTLTGDSVESPSISIGKSKSMEGGVGETENRDPAFDFESLHRAYPKRDGKQVGMRRLATSIKTQKDFDDFARAVAHYAELVVKRKLSPEKIKSWSTFVEYEGVETWREYVVRPAELDTPSAATKSGPTVDPFIAEEMKTYSYAVRHFSGLEEKARDWLLPERWPVIEEAGGWSVLSKMAANKADEKIRNALERLSAPRAVGH